MLGDHDPQNHSPSIPKLLGSVWVVAAKHIALSSLDNLSESSGEGYCLMSLVPQIEQTYTHKQSTQLI